MEEKEIIESLQGQIARLILIAEDSGIPVSAGSYAKLREIATEDFGSILKNSLNPDEEYKKILQLVLTYSVDVFNGVANEFAKLVEECMQEGDD